MRPLFLLACAVAVIAILASFVLFVLGVWGDSRLAVTGLITLAFGAGNWILAYWLTDTYPLAVRKRQELAEIQEPGTDMVIRNDDIW